MAFKIDRKIEEKIIELSQEKNMNGMLIADELKKQGFKIGKSAVYKYIKMHKNDDIQDISPVKKIMKINELISIRLFWFCADLSIITKRMACEIIEKNPEKIIVPARLRTIIKKEKMDKVANILEAADLKIKLEYATV